MWAELKVNKKFYLMFLLAVFLLSVIFTWPLILDLSHSLYGYAGDSFGFVYYLWWWKRNFLAGNFSRLNPLSEAPFGSMVPAETGNIVFFWPSKLLALIFNEVVSYNLNLLLTFPLAAVAAYLLIFEVTKQRPTAAIFSLVFAFSPYHFWKAYNHLDLAMTYGIPIFVWLLVRLERDRRLRSAFLCGLSLAFLILLNFYYGYFALLCLAVFFLLVLLKEFFLRSFKVWPLFKSYLVTVLVGLVLPLPFIFPVLASALSPGEVLAGTRETYSRPLDNLLLLSARPWSYLLPSIDNPFLGDLSSRAYKFIEGLSRDFKTKMPFAHEATVYLGFFSLIFFGVVLFLYFKGKVKNGLIILLLGTTLVLVLVSMPPFVVVRGVTFYFPSFYLHQVLPMFRSYARLGIFILPFFMSLSALGFSHVWQSLSQRGRKILFLASIFLILFEFTNVPPSRVVSFAQVPEVYQWLQKIEDDFIFLEYPKTFNIAEGVLFQRHHLKKMANWRANSPYFGLWDFVEDIYHPETYEILSGLGIRYVIFHKKLLFESQNPVDELWPFRALTKGIEYERLPKNIIRVKDFEAADVFQIGAESRPKIIVFTTEPKGSVKTEVVNGGGWPLEKSRLLFLLNLSKNEIRGELNDGMSSQVVSLPLGKTLRRYRPGNYQVNFKVL